MQLFTNDCTNCECNVADSNFFVKVGIITEVGSELPKISF